MRGDGRVFQQRRKDGTLKSSRWWIAYYDGAGREVRESAGNTEKEARGLLKKRMAEKMTGQLTAPEQSRLTVDQLLDSYLLSLEARGKKSVADSRSHLEPVRAAFGHRRVLSVTLNEFERYQSDRLSLGRAKQTIDHELGGLRAGLRLAVKQKRLASKDLPYIPMFGASGQNVRQGFIEKADFQNIVSHLRVVLADVTRFAFWSAWRRGEIVGLTWERVDREAREVRLDTSKNGLPRTLPLEGVLWEVIERRWSKREFEAASGPALSPLVFHEDGHPIGDFRKSWQSACVAAGLGHFDEAGKYHGRLFHDLRRSGVRNFVRAGVSQSVAMSISGHRTIAVFQRYNITSTDDQRKALAATQKHVSGSESKVRRIRAKA